MKKNCFSNKNSKNKVPKNMTAKFLKLVELQILVFKVILVKFKNQKIICKKYL